MVAVEGFRGGNVVKNQQARTSSFLDPTVRDLKLLHFNFRESIRKKAL